MERAAVFGFPEEVTVSSCSSRGGGGMCALWRAREWRFQLGYWTTCAADSFCTFQVKKETMRSEYAFRLSWPIGFTWTSTCRTHQDCLSVG
ncbi:hypothetical protein chiPu_0009745 [Chiloscyllium punctatum]|uniref:Uncharacterized protein n=1 Tax=Chiloscyllium punctatum TaxID=137246 RepID=A0A401SLN8_CHIPU|nr:hypothetical protein [Chiloscyllium punctatum]